MPRHSPGPRTGSGEASAPIPPAIPSVPPTPQSRAPVLGRQAPNPPPAIPPSRCAAWGEASPSAPSSLQPHTGWGESSASAPNALPLPRATHRLKGVAEHWGHWRRTPPSRCVAGGSWGHWGRPPPKPRTGLGGLQGGIGRLPPQSRCAALGSVGALGEASLLGALLWGKWGLFEPQGIQALKSSAVWCNDVARGVS